MLDPITTAESVDPERSNVATFEASDSLLADPKHSNVPTFQRVRFPTFECVGDRALEGLGLAQARRAVGVPRASLFPDLERYQSPLQANRVGGGLGHHPAPLHYAGFFL